MSFKLSEEVIKEKLASLNLEFMDRQVIDGRTMILVKCKIHLMEKPRWIEQYNLMNKAKTCGCLQRRLTREEFARDNRMPENIILLGDYVNDGTKTLFKCKTCGNQWLATPNKIKSGTGCPKCAISHVHELNLKSEEEFKKQVKEAGLEIEICSPYMGANMKIKYKCLICGEISESTPYRILSGKSCCHFCKSSIGERKIYSFLLKHNIAFEKEKKFSECKRNRPLPFDFYLPNSNTCIEFQGEQHFKIVDFSYALSSESLANARDAFFRIQESDKIKREFCKKNGIRLIILNYKQKNKISDILSKELNLLL